MPKSEKDRHPAFAKKVLSSYIRNKCVRRLRLSLYKESARLELGMPPNQKARAGVGLVGEMGHKWQDKKVAELGRLFGETCIVASSGWPASRATAQPLEKRLAELSPYQFVVEAKYTSDTDTFRQSMGLANLKDEFGLPLELGDNHADLIQVLPRYADAPAGERAEYRLEVLPTGELRPLQADDRRLRLRIIDIKMAAEPGANYFAEVVYYALTLTSWLREYGHDQEFVVIAASAVWPGSYEDSAVLKARRQLVEQGENVSAEILAVALEKDLEIAPFETFVVQLRRIFTEVLPLVLRTPWRELAIFVNHGCNGCEFLGYPWTNKDKEGGKDSNELWCWTEAEQGQHLSRVTGMTRGSARQLNVANLAELAQLPADAPVFQKSPGLRAQSLRFPKRAAVLRAGVGGLLRDAGSDALMPRWPDLRVYIFLDYDLASAVTITFGLRAFWIEPQPIGNALPMAERHRRNWNQDNDFEEVLAVDTNSLEREKIELLKFLRALRGILNQVRDFDREDIAAGRRDKPGGRGEHVRSTYQIFLWDEAQKRHLQRLIGRHLNDIIVDPGLRDLAWLFPPPELLLHPHEASTRSPFTLVERVVRNTVAVPLPHHYTLFGVAQLYHTNGFTPPTIFELYRDPLSDLIPGERIQEVWERDDKWLDKLQIVKRTTRNKLLALGAVTERLREDLQRDLMPTRLTAPELGPRPQAALPQLPPFSRLLYEFTRLNAALSELESQTVRAMPPHEREARFRSAWLTERLEGVAKAQALGYLSEASGRIVPDEQYLVVYRLRDHSWDVNLRPGDIGYALSPAGQPGFLNQSPRQLVGNNYTIVGPGAQAAKTTVAEAGLSSVAIVAIDRTRGLIALRRDVFTHVVASADARREPLILEDTERVNFTRDVMLDKVEIDALSKKVRLSLQGIGFPEMARHTRAMRLALGVAEFVPREYAPVSPAACFLWQGPQLATEPTVRDVAATRFALEPVLSKPLNPSQWAAWTQGLSRRLSLIWGPPGTGKSQTLRALLTGALLDAAQRGVPLRVLIATHGYTALDNVLAGLPELLEVALPDTPVALYRLQGTTQRRPDNYPLAITSIVPKARQADADTLALMAQLEAPTGLVVVGTVPQQAHNLALAHAGTGVKSPQQAAATQRRWFDLIVIDEASQLDVASTTLLITKAADEAAFVLAGDDLQLPPIHQADAPTDLERHVGSLFEYVRHVQGIMPQPLNVNYRSSAALVGFSRTAGYDAGLRAHSPDLRLNLAALPALAEPPADWPASLAWTPQWAQLLDPAYPAAAFVYPNEVSGQVNDFEAQAIGALVWLLRGHQRRQLVQELDEQSQPPRVVSEVLYDREEFWRRGLGIVAPHRAQMSRIVSILQQLFPDDDPEKIRGAVDTVERFQGQERDVIIASFGVGDPDLIEQEDEFLFDRRRFNVLASRARAKLLVLASESLVNHLSNDAEVLDASRLLKRYVETYCSRLRPLELPYLEENQVEINQGYLYGASTDPSLPGTPSAAGVSGA